MKSRICIILGILVCLQLDVAIVNSQNITIGDFDQYFDFGGSRSARPFVGEIHLEQAPRPLETALITFDLQIPDTGWVASPDEDWLLKIFKRGSGVDLIGDSSFVWSAPHGNGDKFSVSVAFKTTASGKSEVGMYLEEPGVGLHRLMKIWSLIGLEWCLDQDGGLEAIGASGENYTPCDVTRTQYFDSNSDSLIVQPFGYGVRGDRLWHKVSFYPTPSVGDTSLMTFSLTPNIDISEEFQFDISSNQVIISDMLNRLPSSLVAGTTYELNFKIVPRKVSDDQRISFMLYRSDAPNTISEIPWSTGILLVYHDDGKLRFVNDKTLGAVRDSDRPNSWPLSVPSQFQTKTIKLGDPTVPGKNDKSE